MSALAEVRLWGRTIGAVSLLDGEEIARFEYDAAFAQSGIQVAPLVMPLARRVYRFPELARSTFHGLPGLLADSLPDKFGNALIDAWLASQGGNRALSTRSSGFVIPANAAWGRWNSPRPSAPGPNSPRTSKWASWLSWRSAWPSTFARRSR
jgi:hypothetical protein